MESRVSNALCRAGGTYANYDLMLNEQSTLHIGSGGMQ